MPDQRDPMFEVVSRFESEIGMAPGFLERLLEEGDDWSFVIKLHALIEAALTDLLTAAVGREELRDVFRSFSMGDSRRGKLAVAARLRLVDPRRTTFFHAVSRIRNQFVHDIKQAGRRIEDYVFTLPQSEQTRFWRDLIGGYTVEPVIIDFAGQEVAAENFARAHPRFTMWVSAISALALIYRAKTSDPVMREKLFAALSTLKPLRQP